MICKLEQSYDRDISLIGAKGQGLLWLLQHNYKIPETFILITQAFDAYLKHNGIEKKYLKPLAQRQEEFLFQGSWPPGLYKELQQFFEDVKEKNFFPCAVRSSSFIEDGIEKSYAGQFHSELFVSNFDHFLASILKCWSSALFIFLKEETQLKLPQESSIAVIFQPMVNASVSGVLFTCDPVHNDLSKAVLEVHKGLATHIVSGQENCQLYYYDLIREEIIQMPDEDQAILSLDKASGIFETGIEIHYKRLWPQDIEWSLERNLDELILLQMRPVTSIRRHQLLYA